MLTCLQPVLNQTRNALLGAQLCCMGARRSRHLPRHLYPAHAPLQNVLQLTAPLLPFFTLLGATPADRRRAIRRKLFDRRLALQLQNRELQHHRLAVFAESTSTSSPPPHTQPGAPGVFSASRLGSSHLGATGAGEGEGVAAVGSRQQTQIFSDLLPAADRMHGTAGACHSAYANQAIQRPQ